MFSIIFNKPFIAVGNHKRGLGRFISLFEIFNINGVFINQQHNNISPELDYKIINKKYMLYKNESLQFIIDVLKE